jgi:hypothetical protein
MNGYVFADRQLTTGTYYSSLLAKADPSLFKNSIYIQAINRTNERVSLFYDVAPFIVKHFDFETFAIIQAFISIFFIIAGIFTLTNILFGSANAGYIAAFLYTVTLNKWTLGSPAPYLNFFHHGLPYSYPLIIWSMNFFFQRKYPLSFFLVGISWDFHPMCTLFLLFSYFIYWLFNLREFNLRIIWKCVIAFTVPAVPIIIKLLKHLGAGGGFGHLWLEGVRWVSGYTSFPSEWPSSSLIQAGFFLILFLICFSQLNNNGVKKWVLTFFLSVGIMCLIGTVFADLCPVPFLIRISLWRSTVIYLFVAISCIGYTVSTLLTDQSFTKRLLAISLIVIITGYVGSLIHYHVSYLPLFIGALLFFRFENQIRKFLPSLYSKFSFIFFTCLFLLLAVHIVTNLKDGFKLFLFFGSIAFFLQGIRLSEKYAPKRALSTCLWVLIIALVLLFDVTTLYVRGGPKIYYHGRFQGKSDPWAEIQYFARMHSEKNDLFIVPPYMNDFTTYSMRATLGDWAEGSTLIFLDNQFTQEWFVRMNDLGCKPHKWFEEYNNLNTEEILKIAKKYSAQFVVTEKPHRFNLPCVYENNRFALYEITPPAISYQPAP